MTTTSKLNDLSIYRANAKLRRLGFQMNCAVYQHRSTWKKTLNGRLVRASGRFGEFHCVGRIITSKATMSLGQSFAAISQPTLPCRPHLGTASALLSIGDPTCSQCVLAVPSRATTQASIPSPCSDDHMEFESLIICIDLVP